MSTQFDDLSDDGFFRQPSRQRVPDEPKPKQHPGFVTIVSKEELTREQIVSIRTSASVKWNLVWKSRFDRFNGKYIIDAIMNAPTEAIPEVLKQPLGEGAYGEGREIMGGEGEFLGRERGKSRLDIISRFGEEEEIAAVRGEIWRGRWGEGGEGYPVRLKVDELSESEDESKKELSIDYSEMGEEEELVPHKLWIQGEEIVEEEIADVWKDLERIVFAIIGIETGIDEGFPEEDNEVWNLKTVVCVTEDFIRRAYEDSQLMGEDYSPLIDLLSYGLVKLRRIGKFSPTKGFTPRKGLVQLQTKLRGGRLYKKRQVLQIHYVNGKGQSEVYSVRLMGVIDLNKVRDESLVEIEGEMVEYEPSVYEGVVLGPKESTHSIDYIKKDRRLQEIIQEFVDKESPQIDTAVHIASNVFHTLTTVDENGGGSDPKVGLNTEAVRAYLTHHCGTVIFDITRSKKELYDAWCFIKQHLELMRKVNVASRRNPLEPPVVQHLILITNFLTWSKSHPGIKTNMSEATFMMRKPHPDYKDQFALENMVYQLGRIPEFNLRTTIIFSGIPIGAEEDVLVYLYKTAWENAYQLPLYVPGTNVPPLIHIKDLANIIAQTISLRTYPRFIWAVTRNDQNLRSIAQAIAGTMGSTKVVKFPSQGYEVKECIPKIVHDLMKQNVKTEHIVDPVDITPIYENPYKDYAENLLQELKTARELHPHTIIVLGPPSKVKLELAAMLSRIYDVPLLHKNNIIDFYAWATRNNKEDLLMYLGWGGEGYGEVEGESRQKIDEMAGEMESMVRPGFEKYESPPRRTWLVNCLKKVIHTTYVKQHGYVLTDVPSTYTEAVQLFSDTVENGPGEDESHTILGIPQPEYVIYVNAPEKFIDTELNSFSPDTPMRHNSEIVQDLKRYMHFHKRNRSAVAWFDEKEQAMCHTDVLEPEKALLKCVAAIGIPTQVSGLTEFNQYLHRQANSPKAIEYRAKKAEAEELAKRRFERENVNELIMKKRQVYHHVTPGQRKNLLGNEMIPKWSELLKTAFQVAPCHKRKTKVQKKLEKHARWSTKLTTEIPYIDDLDNLYALIKDELKAYEDE